MRPVLVFRHDADVPPGDFATVAAALGVPLHVVRLDRGEAVPGPDDPDIGVSAWSGVVSLGGTMGVYDADRFPFLDDEAAFLAAAEAAGVPVLGVCLGCQLLAAALGGRAYLAPAPEVAFTEVRLTEAGEADPMARALAEGPVVVWHQDTWDLPPDATLLAVTDRYPQAFRRGSALGVQPHPEATPEILERWAEIGGHVATRAGVNPQRIVAAARKDDRRRKRVAEASFGAWCDNVAARERELEVG